MAAVSRLNPAAEEQVRRALGSIDTFCLFGRRRLRSYQSAVTLAVQDMLRGGGGRSMAVMLPRQSGKNELQAHLEAYLLMLFHNSFEAEIIKIAPTWAPQSLNALRRLERVLAANPLARSFTWQREGGNSIRMGRARISFFSGQPGANIVGATASLLLSVDEAQHIDIAHYDTHIAPMAAARNTPRIFWGTAWTADTLLAREMAAAEAGEDLSAAHGQRAFRLDAEQVGREVPAYAAFVAEQVRRLGRDHPAVRSQYFSEAIEAAGGMFSAATVAGLQGGHAWEEAPRAGALYAFLLDVGGEEAGAGDAREVNPSAGEHDATALVIVAVESAPNRLPHYRVVHLREWQGWGQPRLLEELGRLAGLWKPRRVVVDASGLGQGLAAGLEQLLPGRVRRFVFSAASKSQLGWDFAALCQGGRLRLPAGEVPVLARLRLQFLRCTRHLGSGPGQPLRWEVPAGARDEAGALLHDDLLMATALVSTLDQESWPLNGEGWLLPARDPLREIDRDRYR